jgi:cysteinyl-tRNA synthetase
MLDVIKEANIELRKREKDYEILKEDFYALTDMAFILGLHFEPKKMSDEDVALYKEYLDAKTQKDFEKSDSLRKKLIERKII